MIEGQENTAPGEGNLVPGPGKPEGRRDPRPGGKAQEMIGFFEVGDIMIAPTAARSDERNPDGSLSFRPARQRGVVGGILEAMRTYGEDISKRDEVIREIAQKAIDQKIFTKEELTPVFEKHGIEVTL